VRWVVLATFTTCWAADGQEIHELDPYIVEVTRSGEAFGESPVSLSRLDSEAIQRSEQQLTLDESLEGVPGVFILNPFNYAQDTRIAIRGFGARADFGIRGIQLLVDGIPATTPDGQGEVDGLDLGSAGRIEVLRGPGSVFYGAASGGVILVETEDPGERPFLETRLTAGEDAFRHIQFKAGGHLNGMGALLSGGHVESDGFRAHNETRNTRFAGKVDGLLQSGGNLRLVFNGIDFPIQNDPGGLTRAEAEANPRQARARNVLYDSGEAVKQQRVGFQYEGILDARRTIEAAVHYTQRDFANRLPFESGGQVEFDRQFHGTQIQYRYRGDSSIFVVGADLDRQEDQRRNFDNIEGARGPLVLDQEETVTGFGAFAYHAWEFAEQLKLTTALRQDIVRFEVTDDFLADGDDSGVIEFEETTPMVALSWVPRVDTILYARASSSFETPTTTEFDNPMGAGFNPELESQTARSVEVGIRGRVPGNGWVLSYDLAAFTMDIDGALVPYELPGSPGREFYRNAGSSTRNGVELALDMDLPAGFSIALDYTWSDFSYDRYEVDGRSYAGNRIPGIPEHFGGFRISYENTAGLFAELNMRLVGSFQANDENTETIRDYAVTSLRMGHRLTIGNWEFEPFLGLNNLEDTSYFGNIRINAFGGRYFEPAPGRTVYGGLRIRTWFE
jgi:iron complex outermembrane receptor protein